MTFRTKFVIWAAPLALVFGLPFIALAFFGELLPVSTIVQLEKRLGGASLVGLAYSNPVVRYKLVHTLERRARVLVLGTSRVMQFRGGFFKDPTVFYNAGGGISDIAQLRVFLGRLSADEQPDVLIVGLDQYFFTERWRSRIAEKRAQQASYQSDLRADNRDGLGTLFAEWDTVYHDYRHNEFVLAEAFRSKGLRIGMTARAHAAGFRPDGSYDYGDTVSPDLETRLEESMERIAMRGYRFEPAAEVSRTGLAELDEQLRYAKARGIHVVGFLPPYAHAVYLKMLALTPEYDYLLKLAASVKPIFQAHGFTVVDYSDLAWLGVTDMETIDGFHASEAAHRRIFAGLVRTDAKLAGYARSE